MVENAGPIAEPNIDRARLSADACYPYLYFHTDFMLQLFGQRDPPNYNSLESMPTCPVFFAYGKRKPVQFHLPVGGEPHV